MTFYFYSNEYIYCWQYGSGENHSLFTEPSIYGNVANKKYINTSLKLLTKHQDMEIWQKKSHFEIIDPYSLNCKLTQVFLMLSELRLLSDGLHDLHYNNMAELWLHECYHEWQIITAGGSSALWAVNTERTFMGFHSNLLWNNPFFSPVLIVDIPIACLWHVRGYWFINQWLSARLQ